MANYGLVITDAGLAAARTAQGLGYKISIERIKIGDSIVNPDNAGGLDEVVGNVVFDSDVDCDNITDILTSQLTGSSGIQFRVYLTSAYGDFDMGNIGLYITDPATNMQIMFAIGCLGTVITKEKKSNTSSGNSFKLYLNTQLSGVSNVLNMTTDLLNEGYIPVVQTESDLPVFGTQKFNCYQIMNYAATGQIALAVAGVATWEYIQPSSSVIFAEEVDFDSSVGQYDTVRWDGSVSKYVLGDGRDPEKGVLGIRVGNNVIIGGYIVNPGGYVDGTRYYADGGANAGKLTTSQTYVYIGQAISNDVLLLGLDSSSHASTSDYGTIMLATPQEVHQGTNNTKAVTPADLETYYTQNSNDEEITGAWTFSNEIGFNSITTTGNASIGGSITVAGATQLNDSLTVASGKATSLGGTLSVANTSSFNKDVTMEEDLLVKGTLTVNGASTLKSTLAVTGATTLSSTLAAGNTTITGTLSTSGKATLNSLGVTNNATVGGTLGVTGNTTIGGTLGVTGNSTFTGTSTFNNAVTMSSTLGVSGNTSIGGNATVTGTLGVTGKSTLAATDITGALAVSGNGTFSGTTYTAGGSWTFSDTITGTYFTGTAYKARWGDLAELYESDTIYPKGTLVKFGGDKDLTIADDEANAVISSDPGMILGDVESPDAQPIALVGKVPVRITGKINKFDKIVLSEVSGVARKYNEKTDKNKVILGKAMRSKDYTEEDLVLCVVQLKM